MSHLQLPVDLSIEAAEALKTQLCALVKNKRAVKIDATQVSRLHSASVQILCAFFIQRKAATLNTEISNPSEELCSATRLMGVDNLLGLNPSNKMEAAT